METPRKLRSATDIEALTAHVAATIAQNDSMGGFGTLDRDRVPWYVDLAEDIIGEIQGRSDARVTYSYECKFGHVTTMDLHPSVPAPTERECDAEIRGDCDEPLECGKTAGLLGAIDF